MHPHLIDWFRNVHIHPEPKVVEQRWKTAGEYAQGLSRASVPSLLRVFLFQRPAAARIKWFTEGLLELDKEFPVANNVEELRLMAGIVMVTTFSGSSKNGNAFALGLLAASTSDRSIQPAQPEIVAEAESYLRTEAEKQRPSDFGDTMAGEIAQAEKPEPAYRAGVAQAIEGLAEQVRRLAEETAMLWWVVAEYSPSLKRPTAALTTTEYSLIAGAEAAARTDILPPPPSVGALLARALKACKPEPKETLTLSDFISAADANWRGEWLRDLDIADCADLVPIIAGLAKCEEFRDPAAAVKVLPNICPGLNVGHPLSSSKAAYQLYVERMFLKALAAI